MANELKPYVQRVNTDDEAVNQIITVLNALHVKIYFNLGDK
ncbi:hypothetical protein [Sulfurospirillum arcachonense]|nr:hypothetical protein [Sulfurospirillum arcachonense]